MRCWVCAESVAVDIPAPTRSTWCGAIPCDTNQVQRVWNQQNVHDAPEVGRTFSFAERLRKRNSGTSQTRIPKKLSVSMKLRFSSGFERCHTPPDEAGLL